MLSDSDYEYGDRPLKGPWNMGVICVERLPLRYSKRVKRRKEIMKSAKLIIGACICTATLLSFAQEVDNRPALKESPEILVRAIESITLESVMAARVNVTHDVAKKRVRIFSIIPGEKSREFKEDGYDMEIIYNANIASSKVGVGSYHFQHNNQILAFAAAQYASGKKKFGRFLIGRLAEAEPDLAWSSPTHPVMTIQEILAGLEKDDETVRDFLKDESEYWNESVKIYGA
jgi:hypothetical protein